jgi:hypothetical protein
MQFQKYYESFTFLYDFVEEILDSQLNVFVAYLLHARTVEP